MELPIHSRPAASVPSRPASIRSFRHEERDFADTMPYASRASTPATITSSIIPPLDPAPSVFFNAEGQQEEITLLFETCHEDNFALLLDTVSSPFALKVLPTPSEIYQFSTRGMIIIPLLCSIANARATRPRHATPPASAANLSTLQAPVVGLSARLMFRRTTSPISSLLCQYCSQCPPRRRRPPQPWSKN